MICQNLVTFGGMSSFPYPGTNGRLSIYKAYDSVLVARWSRAIATDFGFQGSGACHNVLAT